MMKRSGAVVVFLGAVAAMAVAEGGVRGGVTLPSTASFPVPPFTRELSVVNPLMSGTDVYILQNLLVQGGVVAQLAADSEYGPATAGAVSELQSSYGLPPTGELDATTATVVLSKCTDDGWKDNSTTPADLGYMYKVHVPVHRNRSIETTATLYDAQGNVNMTFTVRSHGHDASGPNPWPTFNSSGDGLNMYSTDGNTPTGLFTFDLNSPEPIPSEFGPYPINRAVQGLEGNGKWLYPEVRSGILLHTGEWTNATHGAWNPPLPMPNSDGCIHAYPEDIKQVWETLVSWGVEVRKNPFGQQPYPYTPQGLLAVELVDT